MPYKHKIPPAIRVNRRRQHTFKSVPKGHRLLRYGEQTQEGDLFWSQSSNRWRPAVSFDIVICAHFCRPNATPPNGEQPTKSLGIKNA